MTPAVGDSIVMSAWGQDWSDSTYDVPVSDSVEMDGSNVITWLTDQSFSHGDVGLFGRDG
jgi:predicted acyl esterase